MKSKIMQNKMAQGKSRKRGALIWSSWPLCFLLFVCSLRGDEPAIFAARVVVASNRITASDLLASETTPALKVVLDRIDLGYAPLPGYEKTFNRLVLARILEEHGLPESRDWKIPEKVIVLRRSRLLMQNEIEKAAADYIRKMGTSSVRVEAASITCPSQIYVPDGGIRLEFSVPRRILLGKRLDVQLSIYSDAGLVRKQWIQAMIDYTARIPVATRDINPFETIHPGDYALEERQLDTVVSKLLDPNFSPDGQVTRRLIKLGEMISPYYVAPPILVKLGDHVTIVVKSETFAIQTEGIARGAGRMGDRVSVLNSDTRKILLGRIIGEKKIEVES